MESDLLLEDSIPKPLSKALTASELEYFRAGASQRPMSPGELTSVEGFIEIPAACVLHNVDGTRVKEPVQAWIEAVEQQFRQLEASVYRIYITSPAQAIEGELLERGYRAVHETGLATPLDQPLDIPHRGEVDLVEISSEEQYEARRRIYRASTVGADGHDMMDGRFADFEKIKQETGYMTSFLLNFKGSPLATVSLSINSGFARLKNLFVHPDYRDKGFGKKLVKLLMLEASDRGASHFGAFAVEFATGYKTYLACGLRPLVAQTEYSRRIHG